MNAKHRECFLPIKWSKVFFNIRPMSRIASHSIGCIMNSQNSIYLTIWKVQIHKIPFGLAQAPAYFQELMTGVLTDFMFAITYLDDIIIFSRTAEEHLSYIKQVFEKMRNAHLSIKLSKCHFFTKEIQYLRHILSTKVIRPLPSKT